MAANRVLVGQYKVMEEFSKILLIQNVVWFLTLSEMFALMKIALHCMYECRWMLCTDGDYTWPQWVGGYEESTDTFVDGWCLLPMQHHWPLNRLRLRVSGKGAMWRSLERWIFLCWEKLWCSMFASLHSLTLFLTPVFSVVHPFHPVARGPNSADNTVD